MPTPAIFRSAKNKIGKYSEAQIKVRNATSNDPGGPSLHALIELASLSFNPLLLDEMVQILIKRLNDDGKNWRHIYKSLKVFEFLSIHGSNYALEFCRRNMHYFESLKAFQHFKDSRESGGIIREAANKITLLLTNENELNNARSEAKNVSEAVGRKNQISSTHAQSNTSLNSTINTLNNNYSVNRSTNISEDLRKAFPNSAEEEDCQLQVALALSKEEFICEGNDSNSTAHVQTKSQNAAAASVDDLLMIDFSNVTTNDNQNNFSAQNQNTIYNNQYNFAQTQNLLNSYDQINTGINQNINPGLSDYNRQIPNYGINSNFVSPNIFTSAHASNSSINLITNSQNNSNTNLTNIGYNSNAQNQQYFNPFGDFGSTNEIKSEIRPASTGLASTGPKIDEIPYSPIHPARVSPNEIRNAHAQTLQQFPVQNSIYGPNAGIPGHAQMQQTKPQTRLPEITPFNTNKPNEKSDPFDFLNDFISAQDPGFRSEERKSFKPVMSEGMTESGDTNNPFL